jgi:hypothetical protein
MGSSYPVTIGEWGAYSGSTRFKMAQLWHLYYAGPSLSEMYENSLDLRSGMTVDKAQKG